MHSTQATGANLRLSLLNWRSLTLWLALAMIQGVTGGFAQESSGKVAQPITAALVPAQQTEVTTLLESRLLELPDVTWLDRAEIDKLVEEQTLQSLFSPDEPGKRAQLGQLLKADVLVLVREEPRPDDPQKKNALVTISETRQGLRLLTGGAPSDKGAEAAVDTLVEVVKSGLARQGQAIDEICAVPPFISQDLGYQFDHLRTAYATLVEQVLASRPGVLLVELAEAQALAREQVIGGDAIRRKTPLYFLGEYRNDGQADARQVRFELRLMRGEKELGKTTREKLAPDDVPEQLRTLTARAIDRTLKRKQSAAPAPPAEEARLLARRGQEFLDLGQAEDALRMYEASLLLEPGNLEVLHEAVEASQLIVLQRRKGALNDEQSRQESTIALTAYRRGLDHLSYYVDHGGDIRAYRQAELPQNFAVTFAEAFPVNYLQPRGPTPELSAMIHDVREQTANVFWRIVRRGAHANWDGEEADLLTQAYRAASDPAFLDRIEELIIQTKDLPNAELRTEKYLWAARAYIWQDQDGKRERRYDDLCSRLQSSSSPEVRNAATKIATEKAAMAANSAAAATAGRQKWNERPGSALEPLHFHLQGGRAAGPEELPPERVGELLCRPVGTGVDLWWSRNDLYVMKEKGVLKGLWHTEDINDTIAGFGPRIENYVSFDGRYVWATARRIRKPPQLLVIDTEIEKVWDLSEKLAGLFPMDGSGNLVESDWGAVLGVAGVGPGEACIVGSYGQTWVAGATFDPTVGGRLEVFHEARFARDTENPDLWKRTDAAFVPGYMNTVWSGEEPDRAETWIVIRREGSQAFAGHPLLVHVADRSVSTSNEFMPLVGLPELSVEWKGRIYQVDAQPSPDNPELGRFVVVRRRPPDFAREIVGYDPPRGRWITAAEKLCVVDNAVWLSSFETMQFKETGLVMPWFPDDHDGLATRPPDAPALDAIGASQHYGLLARTLSPAKVGNLWLWYSLGSGVESKSSDTANDGDNAVAPDESGESKR